MTFTDVVIKNLKYNASKYIAYFLSGVFIITVLFMHSTIVYNPEIISQLEGTTLYSLMKGSFGVLTIFSFFFIGFINSYFMRERNKEFGMFLTLGMTKKYICKIMIIENLVSCLVSIIFGLIFGMIFSRLFFMLVIKIIGLDIEYYVNPICFFLSLAIFICIFIIICVKAMLYTNKLQISQLLKENKKSEKMGANKPLYAFIGIVIIIISCILMYLTIIKVIFERHVEMVGAFMAATLVGLYICISHFSSALLFIAQKNENSYFKNIINLKEVQYRFVSFKNILYILSLCAAMCIYFIGGSYANKILFPRSIDFQFPYDIMYIETDKINNLEQSKLCEIVNKSETPLIDKKDANFMLMDLNIINDEESFWSSGITVISEREVNNLSHKTINVKKGYALQCTDKKSSEFYTDKKHIKLKNRKNGEIYTFNYGGINISGFLFNRNGYITNILIVLDEEDFTNILNKANINTMGKVHLLKFKETAKTDKVYRELFKELKKVNKISDEDNVWDINKKFKVKGKEIDMLKPISKLREYETGKSESGFYLFSMLFIGVIFFISSGVVLYFRILSESGYAKVRYKKLFKIGITEKEMKHIISKELRYIFISPAVIGGILGFVYIAIHSIESQDYIRLLINILPVIGAYLIIHAIFYYITRKKYLERIVEE